MIPGTWMCILYIGHTDSGIADPVVDHCIHWYCHAVFGQHLFIIVQIFLYPLHMILPLEGEPLMLWCAGQLSGMIQCREEWKIFL